MQHTLQYHHQQHQHNTPLRIDFFYSDLVKSSNNIWAVKKDVQVLVEKLIQHDYITACMWGLAFNQQEGIHIHALFYLGQDQHEALALMAMETLWEKITSAEGYIYELDCEDDIIEYFVREATTSLFQPLPEPCVGFYPSRQLDD